MKTAPDDNPDHLADIWDNTDAGQWPYNIVYVKLKTEKRRINLSMEKENPLNFTIRGRIIADSR